ncbi:MAG: hypothetical protein FJX47_20685, partial [Alphaproteobacteria bacterium]|nr:hypothetical protein [Alphaproteobacteria bacterium]
MSDDRAAAPPPNGLWRRVLKALGLARDDEGLRENLEALLGTAKPEDKTKDEAEPEPRPEL